MHPRTPIHAVLLGAGLLLAGLCAAPTNARAYDMTGAGGKVGFISPEDLDGTVMVGGHLEFEQNDTRVHLVPNLMYWKVDGVSDVNPNFDVYYHFSDQTRSTPYVGGGLGLNVENSDLPDRSRTALGANLIGGLRIPSGSNHYFVEGRFTASDVPQVAVVGGITFHTH